MNIETILRVAYVNENVSTKKKLFKICYLDTGNGTNKFINNLLKKDPIELKQQIGHNNFIQMQFIIFYILNYYTEDRT